MFIRNLSGSERVLLAICVALIAVFIAHSLVIEPIITRWKAFNSRIEAKTALLKKNTRLLEIYDALEAEYARYHGLVRISENKKEEPAKTLEEIEALSKKSSCRISNVKPRAPKKMGDYSEVIFEVTAEGSMDEFSKFLYEVETSGEYLRVGRFTIMSKSRSNGGLRGTFLISKIVFR